MYVSRITNACVKAILGYLYFMMVEVDKDFYPLSMFICSDVRSASKIFTLCPCLYIQMLEVRLRFLPYFHVYMFGC